MGHITIPGAPAHTSYSAFNSYIRCGAQYYLERVERVPNVPSWAMIGGSALHKATEDYDYGLELMTFDDYIDEQVEDQMRRNPDVDPSEYRATGRASKEWPNKHDLAWWLANGPGMVEDYGKWREETQWPIWTAPGNMPAIELEMNFQLPGGPVVKAYIDRIFEPTPGNLIIDDIKSGKPPENTIQNGLYATGCELVFGTRPRFGAWWSPTVKGFQTEPHNLDRWTPDLLATMYNQFVTGVNNGIFLPHVTNMCNGCGVKKFCTAYGGDDPKDTLAFSVKSPVSR